MKFSRMLYVLGAVAVVFGLLIFTSFAGDVQAAPSVGNVDSPSGSTVAMTPTIDWALAGLLVSGLVITFARPSRFKQNQK